MSRQKRLGRGLDALLGSSPAERPDAGGVATVEMAVSSVTPGQYQPRRNIDEKNLTELADSIRQQGVLQPLIVRPLARPNKKLGAPTHEIVAGERRWRAAQIAALATVPVVIRDLDDQSALAIALIENLQREDLNPMEQANSLFRLAQEFTLTHQQIAEAVGCSRSTVSNLLRLLDLHGDVKELLADGRIDMGHARALLSLKPDKQVAVARSAVTAGLSVRQVERAVRTQLTATDAPAQAVTDMQTRWLQDQLARELGQKIAIRTRKDGSRKLDICFDDLEQLQAALRKIETLIGQVRETAGPRVRDSER